MSNLFSSYIDKKYKPTRNDLVAEFFVEPRAGMTIQKAAGHVAAESSIGTWTDISTMNPNIAHKLRPSVYSIKRNYIKIAYPSDLFEPGNMPQILSSIAGNIFGMKDVANIRLMDINFPKKIVQSFKGPRHGINGIRKILGVSRRPLVGTIVKPKVGLSEKQHSEVAYDAWAGGLDIVKDDENLSSMSFNKFKKRINLTLKKRDRAEKETGEKKIYMPNCTAETFEMLKRAEYVKQNGGEYCMVDILTCGWSSLQTFRNNVRSVIHAHRAGHGAFTRYEKQGITMLAIAKIARLIGVDQLHIGTANVGKMEGSANDVCEIEDEIEENFITERGHVLEQRWHDVKPVFAVASGGLHPGGTAKVMRYMGKNIVMQYGGGCHGHPDGTFAGAKAIRQSVDASMKGIGLAEYAKKHKELKVALDKFGIKR